MNETYDERILRLSERSVDKRFDAYRDVPWDEPEMRVDPRDPRWELPGDDPLGHTAWYRGLPAETRARLGLHLVVRQMKVGVQFENILSQGLLELADSLPDDAPELRYAYHEVIEESQHSLMFQELIRRSGLAVGGITGIRRKLSRRVPSLARKFPELFFFHVLAGEAPIDCVQRNALSRREELHPLLRRIIRIHTIEEARHLCFARAFVQRRVPELPAHRMLRLRLTTPVVLATTAGQMLGLPREIVRAYRIPSAVFHEHRTDPQHRAQVLEGLEPVRRLCLELGVVTPAFVPWWRLLGIWPEERPRLAATA